MLKLNFAYPLDPLPFLVSLKKSRSIVEDSLKKRVANRLLVCIRIGIRFQIQRHIRRILVIAKVIAPLNPCLLEI